MMLLCLVHLQKVYWIISLYLRNRGEFGVEFSGNFEFSSVGGLSPVVQ